MSDFCIVLPYRYGDILIALPIAKLLADRGHRVHWLVHTQFADLFDGVSYVHPIPFNGDMRNIEDAQRAAAHMAHGARQLTLRWDWGERMRPQPTFDLDIWQKASETLGEDLVPQRHVLPIVFDRRDAARESQLCERLGIVRGQDNVLYNFASSFTTRHPQPAEMESWLVQASEGRSNLVPWARAERIYDLLGVLEQCRMVVTVDTALTHLCECANTPLIDLVHSHPHHQPSPSANVRLALTLEDSMTEDGRRRILDCLWPPNAPAPKPAEPAPAQRPIVHIYHWYKPNAEATARIAAARKTWDLIAKQDADYRLIAHSMPDGGLAKIRDVLDMVAQATPAEGIALYTNTDILMVPGALHTVREVMADGGCAFAQRIEVSQASRHPKGRNIAGQPVCSGTDLFAFTPKWWAEHRAKFPGALWVGHEGWDWILRRMMLEDRGERARILRPIIYHQRHVPAWKANPQSSEQKHNRDICRRWATDHGYTSHLRTDGFLFTEADANPPSTPVRPKQKSITIVQLARAGDILSILPVAWHWHQQGAAIQMVISPEFLRLFDSIRYVTPIIYRGPDNNVGGAAEYAKTLGYDDVRSIQVNGNPNPMQQKSQNFIVEQWQRAGEFDKFGALPLVIDGRQEQEDRKIVDRYLPRTNKPILGYCLKGQSSKFDAAPQFEAWLRQALSGEYDLLNMGAIVLPSVIDLLPLVKRCTCLLSIDTALLHLSYATRTPIIALQRSAAWYQSEPRAHWIERLTYEESLTTVGHERIYRALARLSLPADNALQEAVEQEATV